MHNIFTGKIIFFLVILFINITMLQAQITIQSNEYNVTFGTKHYLYSAVDSVGNGFDVTVGTTGGPQTWNFTLEQFPDGGTEEYTVVDPASTPFADIFSQSNHVWYNYYAGDSASIYQYFTLTASALFMDAMVITDGDSSLIIASEPSEKVISFPAQMGESWTNNYAQRTEISLLEFVDSTSSVSTIDAWGTINIPAGSFDCLRIREDEISISNVYLFGIPFGSDTSTYISYTWVGKNYGILASITSDADETNPNFTKAFDVTIRTGIGTAIDDNLNLIVNRFDLFLNYPNPFNPVTTITYNLNRASDVKLTIYNAIGQEVQTLLNQRQSAGKHDIVWDAGKQPSGVYFCELRANEQSSMRKMILIK